MDHHQLKLRPLLGAIVLLPLAAGQAFLYAATPDTAPAALTNWQGAVNTFQKAGALLAKGEYQKAQAELRSSATNLPAPYAQVAEQDLVQMESAFNRAKDDEAARLEALSTVCMSLHAYQSAAQLHAAAQGNSTDD